MDQENGRILVYSGAGQPLADLKVATPDKQSLPGIYLANKHGDLRLERLRVNRWSGDAPGEFHKETSGIQLVDRSSVSGEVARLDAAAHEFVIRGPAGESRIAEDRVASLICRASAEAAPRSIRVSYQDGTRLSGDLIKVENDRIQLSVPGFSVQPALPVEGVRSIVGLRPREAEVTRDRLVGRLELDGVRLRGRMADGRGDAGASCLAWQPLASESSSRLRPDVSGRIFRPGAASTPASHR